MRFFMNKLKKVSVIFIFLCLLLITNAYASTATVDVSAARLRKEANTTSNVLTKIYKNEKVEILETEGDWYKVKYKNQTGYLKKDLVKEDVSEKKDNESTYDSSSQPADSSKVTIKNNTAVRFTPNMMSNSIIQVEAGKELTKVTELGNWVQVTDGIFTGWVLKIKTNIEENKQQVDSSNFETSTKNNTISNETNTANKNNTTKETNTTKNTTNTANKVKENNTSNTVKNTTKESNTTTTNNSGNTATAVSKKGKVNVETAKVREKANSTAKVIGFLDYNDVVEITAEDGDWYKFTEKSISGYVHKTLVTITENGNVSSRGTTEDRKSNTVESVSDNTTVDSKTNESLSESLENSVAASSNGQSVVDYAKQFLGYPYVVGGKNPTSGFDCSGFTRYVFLNFGHSLGATAATQNNIGTEITRENLMPGDLILFYDEGKTKIGHTGIYISNGDFIHAANPTRGVVTDNLNTNSYYNTRFITARRIVE